jgi:HEAT repeat protein
LSVLVEGLRHRHLAVRTAAAEALGRLGPLAMKALPPLREATDDAEVEVRRAARKALQTLTGTRQFS